MVAVAGPVLQPNIDIVRTIAECDRHLDTWNRSDVLLQNQRALSRGERLHETVVGSTNP
jgi:hypothetical protein